METKSPETAPKPRSAEWRWWLALAAVLCPICWNQINTSDAWWHVALGKALAERWKWPDFSTFYFTPIHFPVLDLRWTAAGDVLLFMCYCFGGTAGLQGLSLTCLAVACFLLRHLYRGVMNGWLFFLLFAVAAATHQLQLPRNAVFSLPLVALVLWIFAQWQKNGTIGWLWLYPPILVFWGVVHGSYLLGMALVASLLFGDWVDWLLKRRPNTWRFAVHAAAIFAVSASINAVGNPSMLNMPTAAVRSIFRITTTPKTHMHASQGVAESDTPRLPQTPGWKDQLNRLIWVRSAGQIWSGDFDSPFDRLSYRPVLVAFLLGIIACGRVFLLPRPSMGWVFAFAGLTLLGLCYLRMTGYAAIGAASLLLIGGPVRGTLWRKASKYAWVGTAATVSLSMVVYGAWLIGRLGDLIGHQTHVPGPGKICTFDDPACDWILQHHSDRPVFTTIVTGSYALSRWVPRKRVFVDGFFAPHPSAVWHDYARARDHAELWRLHKDYGTELALIEHTRRDWTRLFIASKEWQPAAIGLGCMVYVHSSVAPAEAPQLLFSGDDARRLAPVFQEGLAYDYYGALVALFTQKRAASARQFVRADPTLFVDLRNCLHAADRWVVPLLEASLRGEEE